MRMRGADCVPGIDEAGALVTTRDDANRALHDALAGRRACKRIHAKWY